MHSDVFSRFKSSTTQKYITRSKKSKVLFVTFEYEFCHIYLTYNHQFLLTLWVEINIMTTSIPSFVDDAITYTSTVGTLPRNTELDTSEFLENLEAMSQGHSEVCSESKSSTT